MTPRSARPATSIPVTAPDLKATSSPSESDTEAACAVRTFARTETFMPMKPAAPDRIAPIAKPIPTSVPSSQTRTKNRTIPTAPMVRYWRFR